ncbi:MAG: hypothetical protein WCH10_02300 [bacterium]
MKIFPDKQLTVKETWLASFWLYSKAFPRVWLPAIMMGIIASILTWVNMRMVPLAKKAQVSTFKLSDITSNDVIYIFILLVLLLLMAYIGGVLLHRIYMVGKEQEATLQDSFVFVLKKYFQFVCGVLLVFCICLLGVFVLLLPGIFMFVLLIMVQPLILFDDKWCFAALKSSCKLVWGNWWHTFAVLCPLMVFNCAVGFGAQFILSYGCWWCGALASMLTVVLFYPLLYACVLIQFGDLMLRRHTRHKL